MLKYPLPPELNDHLSFAYSSLNKVPAEPGCYVLTAFNGATYYIGKSENLRSRMEDHLGDSSKKTHTSAGETHWFAYKLVDASLLASTEQDWINQYKNAHSGALPPFNKINPPT